MCTVVKSMPHPHLKSTLPMPEMSTNDDASDEWIALHFKLKDEDWNYMNHSITVRTRTKLTVIKSMLKKKHGPLTNLVICKDEYLEKNELICDLRTLHEYGFRGGATKETALTATLYYDFNPAGLDPLLLN